MREAEPNENLCIFHLPVGSRGKPALKFWRHFANYYLAQRADPRLGTNVAAVSWVEGMWDDEMLHHYTDTGWHERSLDYRGFVFPAMDHAHNLQHFAFATCNFTAARFGRRPIPQDLTDQPVLKRRVGVDGEPAMNEPPAEPEEEDATSDADFSHVRFFGDAVFVDAEFLGRASFSSASFGSRASFRLAEFLGGVDCTGTHFGGSADFRARTLDGKIDFSGAVFDKRADFGEDVFTGSVAFKKTQFASEAEFSDVHFESDADFTRAKFDGPTDFRKTHMAGPALLYRTALQETLTFEKLHFERGGVLLLWGLDYARGRSRFTASEGSRSGEISESAANVLFRDMPVGMGRISFLRSDIYYDRPVVRFANVLWEPKARPKHILYDAEFVYRPIETWTALGLGDRVKRLAELYNQDPEKPELQELEGVVRKDVERVVREIRRTQEDFACYSEAGDFHVVEMEYRRRRTSSAFYKIGLWLYWLLSKYGESPSRALWWLLGVWMLFAGVNMLAGFPVGSEFRSYSLRDGITLSWPVIFQNLSDFLHSTVYSLGNLVVGQFRIVEPGAFFNPWRALVRVIEGLLGVSTLTLALLAIRRRFRR
ncbi:MAG TPA: pentapeptide repeat-containing protein [bacterium]|nr:pentapeptide repeat-containing protein [bacterium]